MCDCSLYQHWSKLAFPLVLRIWELSGIKHLGRIIFLNSFIFTWKENLGGKNKMSWKNMSPESDIDHIVIPGVTWSGGVWRLCSGVSRQAQSEAAEESEHQRELVPVLSRDVRHPAVHHRAGEHPAALRLQGEQTHNNLNTLFISYFQVSVCDSVRVDDVLHAQPGLIFRFSVGSVPSGTFFSVALMF